MLRTDRLLLRAWSPSDREAFAALNADPEVMEFFPAPLTRSESDALADRMEAGFAEHGVGAWAVEEISTGEFIGFTGLVHQTFDAAFTPAFEIGYRLARRVWGRGYATEAAREAVRFGFEQVGLTEIVSMTAVGNARSRAVMQGLGMTHSPDDDFDHPRVAAGHPLERHVLYRLTRARWSELGRVGPGLAPRAGSRGSRRPTLHLTVGLPGTGKTTGARRIEVEQQALRLTKDEWMKALYGLGNPSSASDVVEGRLVDIGLRALELGVDVVIDFGLWGRDERSALRQAAADRGAEVRLLYLDVAPGEQRRRLDRRHTEQPKTTWPMSDEQLAEWAAVISIPTPGELDGSEPVDDPPAGFTTWDDWRRHRWPPSIS